MTKPIRKDLLFCHWTGRILGRIDEKLSNVGGHMNKGEFWDASQEIFRIKSDLEASSWAIGKSAARRISKLLDDPHQALKKAHEQVRDGKIGRVGRRRLRPATQAVFRAMNRASNKCK